MSQENVDICRRGYEVFNSGDLEAWIDTLSEDVELDEGYLAPDSGVYRGHTGIRRWLRRTTEVVEGARYEMLRWFHANDVVVADVIVHVRGVGSGVETQAHLAHLARVSDGKVVYMTNFATLDEALEAAGLSE